MKLIESRIFEGYYHVPKNERILINKEGRVIDLLSMTSLLVVTEEEAKYDYPIVNISGQGTVHVHILMAITFIPRDNIEGLTVNHKDGDKLNYRKGNLEWVSRSENLRHAYETGLRKDGKVVLSKDIRTGEVKSYYSVADCARHMKVPTNVIRNYINAKNPYPFNVNYELVYEGDNWRGIRSDNIVKMKPADMSIACVDGDTLMIFDSPEAAGNFLSIPVSKILSSVYNQTACEGMYFFNHADIPKHEGEKLYIAGSFKEQVVSPKRRPIIVKDTTNGHVTEWDSALEFAKVLGVNRSTLQKAIGRNNGKWHQYLIRYK